MSRGLGRIESGMVSAIVSRGKPSSYAEIVAALLKAINAEPGSRLNASRERSLRRALHNLVRRGTLIEINGGKHIRYSLHPADLTADSMSDYRAALNGNYEAARAVAISTVMRLKPDQQIPPSADVLKMAAGILEFAALHLGCEIAGQRKEEPMTDESAD